MTLCPWTGQAFTPIKPNQRFSSQSAKNRWHAAARKLGEGMAETLPDGMLRLWSEGRIMDPYTARSGETAPEEMGMR